MEMIDQWKEKCWTDDEKTLVDFVETNSDLFEDMLFSGGTMSHSYIAVQSSADKGKTWLDDEITIPEQLAYFSYTFFDFYVKKVGGDALGCFNGLDQSITIDPDHLNDEATILHEMIHLHEYVFNDVPLFYRDAYFFCLYKSLKIKIDDLDERIEAHGHFLNEQQLYVTGGLHDILFLLKSYDLDLKKGYKLGTVFGYGYASN